MHDAPLKVCLKPTEPEPVVWTADDEIFVREFERRVQDTIERYNLFSQADKILVAVSGGKDSTVVLHVLHRLGYNVEAVTVDAHIGCYTQQNLENIRAVCKKLGVALHEIPFRKAFGASLCYIRARDVQATKLVLGHNLDDEAQVILMNLFKNRPELNARLGPKIDNFSDPRFVARVKPLYFVREDEVVRYSKLMCFPVKYGKCPCSTEGFRHSVRDFLNGFSHEAKENIVKIFLENRERLQRRFASGRQPSFCAQCDEPSSGALCRACSLLNLVHEKPPEPKNFGAGEFPAGA
jgi:uncharacterized protein (TIGR00269 family)